MDWIRNNTSAFVFIIIFGVAILILTVSSIVAYVIQRLIKHKRKAFKNYVVGIEVDLKNGRVVYFQRKRFSNLRTISLESFYQMLHKKDVLRVKLWFEEIKRNFDFAEKYIETETVNRNSDGFFFLMKATYYDETNQILYLESYQLSRINSSQGRKRINNNEYSVIKRSQIESIFESMIKKRGFIFSIKFSFKNNDVINSTSIEKSILYRLKNEVYAFAVEEKNNRYIYDEYDEQIYIVDYKVETNDEAKALANEIYRTIHSFLRLNALVNVICVSVGGVNLVCGNCTFEESIKKASDTSEAAKNNEMPFLISTEETKSISTFDNSLIDKIFSSDSLKLLFRPIINIKTEQIVGYFSNVKCVDTHFNSYFEIARYTNKVDRNEELLSKVVQQFVSKFFFERPNNKTRLFMQVSLVDLDHLGNVLNNITHASESNLALMFEESEVNANAFSLDLLSTQLKELTGRGFEIALLLKDENTLLENEFYSVFNYFVIGSSMVSKVKDNSRARLSNKFLIESLLQYKRPIVITDLDGWSSIDLFVKSGCTFLSGDDISPSSEMILPIEKTKIARLRKINN